MADFYQDMQQMARELLAPTSSGGLGQGKLELQRVKAIDPDNPWAEPDKQTETIKGAVRGIGQELVGKEVGGTVLLVSDRMAICEVPDMGYQAGDTLIVDGEPVHIISFERIPAAGITAAVRFIIRG